MSEIAAETPARAGLDTLWNEYSYRHEHVWTWLYKLMVAVLALSIAPYLKVEMPDSLKWFLLFPPFLSILLLFVAYPRMNRELEILEKIRNKYREWQLGLYKFDVRGIGIGFSNQIRLFYGLIWLTASINVYVTVVWITILPCGCGD